MSQTHEIAGAASVSSLIVSFFLPIAVCHAGPIRPIPIQDAIAAFAPTSTLVPVLRLFGAPDLVGLDEDPEEGRQGDQDGVFFQYLLRLRLKADHPVTVEVRWNAASCHVDRWTVDFTRFGPHSGASLLTASELAGTFGPPPLVVRRGAHAEEGLGDVVYEDCLDPGGPEETWVYPREGLEVWFHDESKSVVDRMEFWLGRRGDSWSFPPCQEWRRTHHQEK